MHLVWSCLIYHFPTSYDRAMFLRKATLQFWLNQFTMLGTRLMYLQSFTMLIMMLLFHYFYINSIEFRIRCYWYFKWGYSNKRMILILYQYWSITWSQVSPNCLEYNIRILLRCLLPIFRRKIWKLKTWCFIIFFTKFFIYDRILLSILFM